MRNLYHCYEDHITKLYLERTKSIATTQDAWLSPNNVPFMSLTTHFMTNKWELIVITLGIAEIEGENIVYKSIQMDSTNKWSSRCTQRW